MGFWVGEPASHLAPLCVAPGWARLWRIHPTPISGSRRSAEGWLDGGPAHEPKTKSAHGRRDPRSSRRRWIATANPQFAGIAGTPRRGVKKGQMANRRASVEAFRARMEGCWARVNDICVRPWRETAKSSPGASDAKAAPPPPLRPPSKPPAMTSPRQRGPPKDCFTSIEEIGGRSPSANVVEQAGQRPKVESRN